MGVAALVDHGVEGGLGGAGGHAEVRRPLTHGRGVVLRLLRSVPVRVGTRWRRVHDGLLLVWVRPQLPWLLWKHPKNASFIFDKEIQVVNRKEEVNNKA